MTQSHSPTPLPPHKILQWHTQQSQQSCAASGMEMILKSHGIIPLDDFSIQLKYGDRNIGFGEAHELTSRGLQVATHSKLVPALLDHIESEIREGRFPLISLPVHREENKIWFHIYIAEPNNDLIRVIDPATGLWMEGGKVGLATLIGYSLRHFGLPPDYKVDFLTYQTAEQKKN